MDLVQNSGENETISYAGEKIELAEMIEVNFQEFM